MEPKLGDTSKQNFNLPPEPTFHKPRSEDDIPKIVPAALKAEVPPSSFERHASQTPSPTPQTPAADRVSQPTPNDPQALMASLSKDIAALSVPLKKEDETKKEKTRKDESDPLKNFGEKGSDGVILPPEDDLGDPLEPSRTPSVIRSLLLLICLGFVIVAAWQVTLFLQPEILKKEPLNTISQKSCEYLYCPPLRTPVFLTNQVNAVSPGQWELKISVQNQDMRTQKLPIIQLTLENADKSTTQKIFEPSEYSTDPKVSSVSGGGTVNITIPFEFHDGRPTSYRVKVLEN